MFRRLNVEEVPHHLLWLVIADVNDSPLASYTCPL